MEVVLKTQLCLLPVLQEAPLRKLPGQVNYLGYLIKLRLKRLVFFTSEGPHCYRSYLLPSFRNVAPQRQEP